MNVEFTESTENHVIATWENVGFVIWRKASTVAAIESCISTLQTYHRRREEKLWLVTVIESEAVLPELHVRASIMDALRSAQGMVERSGVLILGEGFKVVSIRAVISGILLFTKLDYPHKVFSNPGALSKYLIGEREKPPAHILMRAITIARHAKIEK